MKRKLFLLSLAVVLCFSVSSVQAITTIDLVPVNSVVTLGEQIQIDVFLTSDVAIADGSLNFTYEPGLVSLATPFFSPVTPNLDLYLAPNDIATSGQINGFEFGWFSARVVEPTNPLDPPTEIDYNNLFLARLTFDTDATDPGAIFNSGIGDLEWTYFTNPLDTTPDLTVEPVALGDFVFNSASVQINAVPIPGAFLLLGSGLIGLVGLRKKLR